LDVGNVTCHFGDIGTHKNLLQCMFKEYRLKWYHNYS